MGVPAFTRGFARVPLTHGFGAYSAAVVCAFGIVVHAQPAFAALTIAKTTWNVIGLDSNDVNTGPNVFPVAATVCNTGSDATNLTTTFVWDSSNALINLTGAAVVTRGSLAGGACLRAYYWVAVTRNPSAYTTTRRYHITATADGGLTTATPVRELYIERLISQNRNTSQTPSGPTTVVVGQTYTYNWIGATATQGYEQVENFLTFNDNVFRVLSVQSAYAAGASPIAGMYNDACGWNDDPSSGVYRTCAGTGKAGGNITMSVTVQVIGTGTTLLAGAIYDFSGSSYHYNADFGNGALRVTAVDGGVDLAVTKTDGVGTVPAGGTTTYTVVVSNAGPGAADGAIVSDPAVSGLSKTNVTCTAAGGAVCPASTTVSGLEAGLVVPTLPSGGTVTFTVTALVTAANGSVTNTATVGPPAGTNDPNPANNSATDTDTIPAAAIQADLTITKTNAVSELTAGSTTIYTIAVTNSGPNGAPGATVIDSAPSGMMFGPWTCTTSGGAVCPASGSGNLNVVVTLPVGSSVTFRITATVEADASGTITNTATATPPAGTVDPNPGNNSASDTDPVAVPSSQTDVAISKTDGVSTLTPGSTTTYTLVVSNNGPNAVGGATVTDTAPDGLTFGAWTCSGSGGAVCPATGSGNLNAIVTLPVGGSATFRIEAVVKSDASGTITNTAIVTLPAGVADSNPTNNTATDTDTVLAQRIGVAKSAGAPVPIGPTAFEIPYTIVASNIGPIRATNVQITDALDQTFAAGSPSLSLVAPPTASGLAGASPAQCAVNGSFTGTGSSTALLVGNTNLEPNQGCTIAFRVRVVYPNAGAIPYEPLLNVAVATTHASPGGAQIARDVSDSGTDPAGTNPGAPGDTGGSDDPTPVLLPVSAPSGPSDPSHPLQVLSIAKAASAGVVELGDAITYSIRIRNDTGPLQATSVEDRLPLGFSYVPGTAQLTIGPATVRQPDPLGSTSRSLVFVVPAQSSASEATLTYQARASAGALQGDGMNCARATAADGAQSSQSCARVLVTSGVFTQQACMIGKVFVDRNDNRIQDPEEPGIAGVSLYLEDGTSVLTDGAGGYSYCGLRAGTHVLKVEPATLPVRAALVSGSNRNALDPGSAFLDLKFGEVHRTDFVVLAADVATLAEIEHRRSLSHAGTLNYESTPPKGPSASGDLVPLDPVAHDTSRRTAPEPTTQNPLLAVGVVEGIVSFSSLRRASAPDLRPGDVFDEELQRFSRSFNDGKSTAAGRAAMFMQGTLKRDYRLSVSFDSERPDRGAVFRDIQPDAFYPIYGDASQKRFDAQTAKRVYARIDRGRSHVLYGDLTTSRETPARDLGMYSRTLTGVQHRLEKRNVTVNVFATRDTLRQVIDEIGARGISGPYSVSNANGVSGTEKVEIVTRDRDQPALILSAQRMARFLDYEFEPFSGRLLFRRPIPSMDEHLNPVSIRITYEVDAGGERHWVDGLDGAVKVGGKVELGGSWAQDKSPVAPYELSSGNATIALDAHTTVVAEAAHSVTTVNTNSFNQVLGPQWIDTRGEADGNAARVELNHESHGLRARVYAGRSDATFYNPSATLNGGRTEAGARASYRLAATSQVRGELIRSGDRLTGGTRHGGLIAFESKVTRRVNFEVGLRHASETASSAQGSSSGLLQPFGTATSTGFGFNPIGSDIDPATGLPIFRPSASPQFSAGKSAAANEPLGTTTLRARLSSTFGTAWNAYVEGEQDVTGAEKHMAAVGGEYRAADRARLYARHELISSLDGIYALREGQRMQRTVIGASSTYRSAGEVFSEYRMDEAISGREAQAAIGLRNAWKVRDGVRLSTGFERLNPIAGAGQPATAATFGAELTKSPHIKATSRLEWRREGSTDGWLSTVGLARPLSRNWTMLSKNYYQLTSPSDADNQLQDRFWVGAAYRDIDRNRHNLLSRYELKLEQLPHSASASAIDERRVHVVSTHGDYRWSKSWILNGQYAGKWVREPLDDETTRYAAHLLSGRAGWDLTTRVDVGGLASATWSGSDHRTRKALGAELGVLVAANTWLSLGYNVTGFSDRDFNDVLSVDSTTRGFFLRLRLKFDEDLFRR